MRGPRIRVGVECVRCDPHFLEYAGDTDLTGTTFANVETLWLAAGDAAGSFTDLFITGATLNDAAAVRSYVSSENSIVSHGMFVIAANSAGHGILYYANDASSLTGTSVNTAFYQIADLGAGPFSAATLSDFVFI